MLIFLIIPNVFFLMWHCSQWVLLIHNINERDFHVARANIYSQAGGGGCTADRPIPSAIIPN